MTNLFDLEAATRDLPLIGHLFSADWHGVAVNRRDLLPRLAAAGLSACAPPPLSHQVTLGRAIRAWLRERAALGERAGLGRADGAVREDAPGSRRAGRDLVRVARDGASEWILFALIAEEIDLDALGLRYSTDVRVLVRKATGAMIVTTEALGVIADQAQAPPEARAIAVALLPHWETARHRHTGADLGEMTRVALRALAAVNLREGSGWYFVPRDRQPEAERLRALIEGLPTLGEARPFVLMLGQLDAAGTRRQLARAAHADVARQLDEARQDLAAFAARPDGRVRVATVAGRLAAYRELKRRAALYHDLLGMQQEQIQRQLDELTEQARAIVVRATGGAEDALPARMAPLPGLVAAG